MAKIDAARIWSLNYQLLMSVITGVSENVAKLGLETKELFVLSEVDAHPHPAELAEALSMPKATVTVYVKALEAAGYVRRQIDPDDLRRHRLTITPAGRKVVMKGQALIAEAFELRLARLSAAEQAQFGSLLEKLS